MRLFLPASISGFAIVCLLFAASTTASAIDSDKILFNNGDHMTGRVLSTSENTVSFDSATIGVVSIPRAAIKQIVLAHIEPAAAAVPPAKHSVDCMKKTTPVPDSWLFSLQGAPNKVVLGTQSQEQFGALLGLDLCEGSQLNQTDLAARGSHTRTYKEKSTAIQTDTAGAELQQHRYFSSPQGASVFGAAELFTNNSLGMAMQKSGALGLLSPQYAYKTVFYDFSADVRYINEHLDHSSSPLDLAALRFKQQMHSNGATLSWNEAAWIMPVLNDVHGLQAYATFGPSVAIKPWLHLGLTEEESYLGNAPHPNRKNYFASTISLTIQGGSGSLSK